VPDSLALAMRQFLGRADRLRVDARRQLGYQLTSDVLRYVAPPPPPGSYPEAILTAILMERRRREELRLTVRPATTYAAPVLHSPEPTLPAAPTEGGFHLPG
jgi:hypothetical protein